MIRLPIVATLFLAAVPAAQSPSAPRTLVAGGSIHDSLAGGEKAVFAIDVPAQTAARIVVKQEGIDVGLTLRRAGGALPEHGLDLVAGVEGDEIAWAAIDAAPAAWNVFVSAALPKAARGDYTISLELLPAGDRARALTSAFLQHHRASDTAWIGDGQSFQEAQAGYAAAAAAAHAAGDEALAAEATYQCARVHDNLGDTPGAIELQQRALAMFRATGRRDREARVLDRLGDLSRKIGEVGAAEQYFQQALPLAREARDPVNIADILNNSGLLMLTLGRFDEAIAQLQSAIPLAQEVNSANVEGALTNNLAEAYYRLGAYDKSIDTYQRGLEVVARLKLPRRTARTLDMMAAPLFASGDRAKAEETVKTAIDLYARAGDHNGEAETLATYGRMLDADGETDRALELFARAQPLLHEVQNRLGEARVLSTWAQVDVDRGDAASALPKADEALRLARLIASPSAEQKALYVRALALQKSDRLDEAIGSIAAAVESVETMRGAIQRNDLRTSYLSTVRGYFDLYIDLLRRKGSAAASFEMSERARARTLLDGLAESASQIRKGVDPRLLARQRAVQAELNAKEAYRAQIALKDGEESPRALAAGRDVKRLLDEWSDARAKIRAASPAYAALQTPEPVSAGRVQKTLLDADSALIEYHLGSAHSYAWVIDRQSISVHELPASSKIDDIARRYHEMLSRETDSLQADARDRQAQDVAALGRRLAAIVWKPIESSVRGKRVLIVADGVLQYVPFAALPDSAGRPLIVDREVVYLPSASVLETIRQHSRPIRADATAAVFADPVFSKNDPRFAAQRDAAAAAQTRASDGGFYGRLRFSRQEAEAIAAASHGAFEALDFNAAKQTLAARDLRKYRILHFATHGSLNAEHPELSGLVFSLVDQSGKPIDGFLRLHEIYNLDLDADLVVLSACRTALGKEVHGEGLIGLTRGFMYAGASRVVSSVWNVDDRASARLMTAFYTSMLSKGLSPASALRDAQLSLLRDPRWSNPHYWAAFGLQGEWK
ncbi:MAG: CHAT domain-containing protein [Acidobacteriia bacterium]|nr:CHAT domain-containing protein [Terriglobia bacterium]